MEFHQQVEMKKDPNQVAQINSGAALRSFVSNL